MDTSQVLTRYKLDVDDFYRMAEAGILGKEDRVELIEMAPIGQGHVSVVSRLNETLVLAFAGQAIVSPQHSIRLDRLNVPQPDFAILKRRPNFYGTGEPAGPMDVLLLIEVADTSLHYDRTVKLPLYALSLISEVWIVDLKRRTIEADQLPASDRYGQSSTHWLGETLSLAAAPDVSLRVDQLFG